MAITGEGTCATELGEAVRPLVGLCCFVVEDSAHRYDTTKAALEQFSRFVPPGGYFVVEDCCVDIYEMRLTDDWPRGALPTLKEWLMSEQGSGSACAAISSCTASAATRAGSFSVEPKTPNGRGRGDYHPRMSRSEVSSKSSEVPERFLPQEMHGELVEAEHVLRYWWASNQCVGRRVLDAGCGAGYGAAMLHAAGAGEVVAIDLSESIVEVARQAVPDNVACEIGDVTSLSFGDATFDVIVCFEVIEHVDDPNAALDELARVLRPDGLLLISSPNRDRYMPGNPHHRHEYVPEELREALLQRFPAVVFVQQHAMLASVVSDPSDGRDLEGAQVKRLVEPTSDDEMYTLAIAGALAPESTQNMVTLTHFLELRRWLDHYDVQQRVLDGQAELLAELDSGRRARLTALGRLAELETALAEVPTLRERASDADLQARELQSLRDRFDLLQEKARRLEDEVARRRNPLWMWRAVCRRVTGRLRGAKRATRRQP
ncbi:MAG: methyltransferase domain-containing protein [Solirubrobacteraceae bacterium]